MIYLDNAATSFPKPSTVVKESLKCIKSYCANPGRSSHALSMKTAEKIFSARCEIASLLGDIEKCERVVFTQNATYALNFAIRGSVKHGDHVLISDLEHNSVFRPIFSLYKSGICSYDTFESANIQKSIEEKIKKNTRWIVSTLCSNVTGKEIPLDVLSRVAKKYNLGLIVDASQYIGHKEIDLKRTPCNILCAPGHKALFGIQGCGFLLINDELERDALILGGSGNLSISAEMPKELPEHMEAGTLPSVSIISLLEGIKFINKIGLSEIEAKIQMLSNRLYDSLKSIVGLKVYSVSEGIALFNFEKIPSEIFAGELSKYGICTRAGLHCAPSAHKLLGTLEGGAVRVSLSYFNGNNDIDALYSVIKKIKRSF
jgi:cysteine desulfurase family protein